MNPFQVVKDFEAELCRYTGALYAVTTTSCTAALLLAVAWHLRMVDKFGRPEVEIPKRTYVGVPMSIIHAGGRPTFRDEEWLGAYQLKPLPVWDSARWFTSSMYREMICLMPSGPVVARPTLGGFRCVSFHWNKTLGIQQGGAILHDNSEADQWLRMARFDGRQEGVAPKDQKEWIIGHHCYMAPETAAAGLVRLANLPRHNEPLPNDEYPELDKLGIFK